MDSIESEERRGKCRGRGGGSSTFMDSIESEERRGKCRGRGGVVAHSWTVLRQSIV